jgi:DDE superfamily endonuclease
MRTLSKELSLLLTTFAPRLTKRVWHHVQVLMVGARLAPGKRPVRAALRVMGLAHAKSFQPYPRVLNRAVWSSVEGLPLLLHLLRRTLAPAGPLVMGVEDTLERRRGAKLQAQGMDREPVRSAHRPLVKARGLRWLSLMLLVPLPWAKRVWA